MLDLEAVEATESLYPEGNVIRRDRKDQKRDFLNKDPMRKNKKNISGKLEEKQRVSFDTLIGSLIDIEI